MSGLAIELAVVCINEKKFKRQFINKYECSCIIINLSVLSEISQSSSDRAIYLT